MRKAKKPKTYSRKLRGKTFTLIGEGTEARVWKIEDGEKRKKAKIIRTAKLPPSKTRFQKRFIATKIAYLLFPKNIPKPLGTDLKKFRMQSKEKKRHKEMEDYFQLKGAAYNPENKSADAQEKLRQKRIKALEKIAKKQRIHWKTTAEKIQKLIDAGFAGDFNMRNISLANPAHPVFYEILDINPKKVLDEAKKQKIKGKKLEEIKRLLAEYNKILKKENNNLEAKATLQILKELRMTKTQLDRIRKNINKPNE